MMITKKTIPRRMFLRGIGSTLALPLLDAMVPAFATSTAANPDHRLSFVYVPNGVIMENWTPTKEGDGYALTPILESLAGFQDRFLVLSGLAHNTAQRAPGEGGGDHPRAGAAYLTGVHPKNRKGDKGISVDQIAAKVLGKHTQLASLELSVDSTELAGVCDAGYSLAFTNTLSWSNVNTPMPMENHPRRVFERLFGDSDTTNPLERKKQIEEDRSILDGMSRDVSRLLSGLGPADRSKLAEYLDAVRDVERRIQVAEEQGSRELPVVERPSGIPETLEQHAKLMFDLQVLAFQCDMTRVITFMMSREQSNRAYPEIGIPDSHHPLSHHQNDPAKIAKVLQINIFHAKLFAYYLEKLRSTRDGDGSLLDHMILVYGSGISDGNAHSYDNLPTLLFGGGAKIKGGRHIRYHEDTPMTNLYLTLLDKLEVPVENLGDSTGRLDFLTV
jgi:hypothetical protein